MWAIWKNHFSKWKARAQREDVKTFLAFSLWLSWFISIVNLQKPALWGKQSRRKTIIIQTEMKPNRTLCSIIAFKLTMPYIFYSMRPNKKLKEAVFLEFFSSRDFKSLQSMYLYSLIPNVGVIGKSCSHICFSFVFLLNI